MTEYYIYHTFNAGQLNQLRAAYRKIETASIEHIQSFHRLFDQCSDVALEQLIEADIKFVSKLARNALFRRKRVDCEQPGAVVKSELQQED